MFHSYKALIHVTAVNVKMCNSPARRAGTMNIGIRIGLSVCLSHAQ